MRTSVKLVFINAAESLTSCRALGAQTVRVKADEIIWVVFVCSSAIMLTTCMLSVLCSTHYKLSKREKFVNANDLSITESSSYFL